MRGTGIGLSGARQIIEQHGGTIGVRSPGDLGSGSTFFFSLPTIPVPAGEAGPDWRIVSLLGRRMGVEGFGHEDGRPVLEEALERLRPGDAARSGAGRAAMDGSAFVAGTETEVPGPLAWAEPGAETAPRRGRQVTLSVRRANASFRGLDAAREIKGFRRIVRPGILTINPADAASIEAGEGEEVEAVFEAGALTGRVHISEALPAGTGEVLVGPAGPAEREALRRRAVHVKLRRKT